MERALDVAPIAFAKVKNNSLPLVYVIWGPLSGKIQPREPPKNCLICHSVPVLSLYTGDSQSMPFGYIYHKLIQYLPYVDVRLFILVKRSLF